MSNLSKILNDEICDIIFSNTNTWKMTITEEMVFLINQSIKIQKANPKIKNLSFNLDKGSVYSLSHKGTETKQYQILSDEMFSKHIDGSKVFKKRFIVDEGQFPGLVFEDPSKLAEINIAFREYFNKDTQITKKWAVLNIPSLRCDLPLYNSQDDHSLINLLEKYGCPMEKWQ